MVRTIIKQFIIFVSSAQVIAKICLLGFCYLVLINANRIYRFKNFVCLFNSQKCHRFTMFDVVCVGERTFRSKVDQADYLDI